MGKTYYVPRSVKGEGRILVIFTMKSLAVTILTGLIGAGIWYFLDSLFGIGVFAGLIITGLFGALGYLFITVKIPDSPYMGIFRKAGGEYLSNIIVRFITFRNRKKIYLYNYDVNLRLNKGGK